jgi:hypothetical protein
VNIGLEGEVINGDLIGGITVELKPGRVNGELMGGITLELKPGWVNDELTRRSVTWS